MSEGVERVAKAIWEARRAHHKGAFGIELEPWGDGSLPRMNGIEAEARAAIEAIGSISAAARNEMVLAEIASGVPTKVAAHRNGTTEQAIWIYASKKGISLRTLRAGPSITPLATAKETALAYYGKASAAQIAVACGICKSTVRNYWKRARLAERMAG
jgi:hypothetical protein